MPTMVASMLSVTICFLMSQIPRAIRFSIESLYFSPDHDKRLIGAVEITESLSNFLTPFSMLITGAAFRATLWRLLKCRTSGAWLITPCHGDALHHDDVIKWKHFPRYWPFVQGIHRSPVTQRPMTRGFDVFLGQHLNKRLSKQSRGWWFETLLCPLWRHCNVITGPLWGDPTDRKWIPITID